MAIKSARNRSGLAANFYDVPLIAKQFANRAKQTGHFLGASWMAPEAHVLIKLGEPDYKGGKVRPGNCGSEFRRRLGRNLSPAALFKQAEHLAIFERSQRG